MDLIGKKVGPYKILEQIGQGGMGVVFKARHEKLGRLVALKMLAPHLANNEEMRARFLREAKLQANLLHPNVVNIFDYIEEGKDVFLVMEYVSGQTLEEMLLQKGKFTIEETLHVAEGVLEALSFMHRKGIIHRDIKPSNIMVTDNGLIKVTDFGIARLVEGEAAITKAGAKVGTLYYMAPELIKSGKVSPLVDIYSLGITLYQLLTGKVPFAGKTEYEIIKGHLEKKPTPINELNPNIPAELAKTIHKALEKKPEHRFQSAADFLKEIQKIKSLLHSKSDKSKKKVSIPLKKPPNITLKWHYIAIVIGVILIIFAFIWFKKSRSQKDFIIPATIHVAPSNIPSKATANIPNILYQPVPAEENERPNKKIEESTTQRENTKENKPKSKQNRTNISSKRPKKRESKRGVSGWVIKK